MPLSEFLAGHKGESAALATAVCWSLTPFFFTAASLRIGGFSANIIRLVLACVFLGATSFAMGAFHAVPGRQTAMLAASGFIGLTLGDAALFEAFVLIGPKRTSLLSATAPIVVALLSIPLLGETMTRVGLVGMAMTLGGVAWVIAERGDADAGRPASTRGVVMGVLAAAGQGLGAMFAKAGMGGVPAGSWLGGLSAGDGGTSSVEPLLGTLTRMVAGCAGMLVYAALRGRIGEVARGTRDRRAFGLTAGGAVCGPFVGVWLSLYAFKHTGQAAVAQTIMACSPVFVFAIASVLHRERPSARAWIGCVVAVLGLAVLAFREEISG